MAKEAKETRETAEVIPLGTPGTLPVVTVTNGVPTAGTGTVSTLDNIFDATNGPIAVKAASTAPAATDKALVVTMSPNSTGIIATGTQAAPSGQYLSTVAAGDVAHDSPDTGNPQKIGGVARNAEPGAVTSADRVNAFFDLVGKQIVLPYSNPENFVSGSPANVTSTASTLLLAAPAAGLRNYITQITVSNKHATAGTDVLIQDGSGGATLYVIPAAALWGGAVVTFPTPLRQPTAATGLYFAAVAAADIHVSASGYKGA